MDVFDSKKRYKIILFLWDKGIYFIKTDIFVDYCK